MNRILTVLFILLLVVVVILQVMSLTGRFPKTAFTPVCPVSAISMVNGKAVIDAKKCIGCKRCVAGIPVPIRETSPSAALSPVQPSVPVPDSIAPQVLPAIGKPANDPQTQPKAAILPKTQEKPTTKQDKITPPAPVASYRVDPAKCIGCTLCVQYCPVKAITMVDGKAVIDPAKCINCGICKNGNGDNYAGCPVNAISGP